MSESLRRLGDAMQLWLEHQASPACTDAELLQRHPELADLLQPLLSAANEAGQQVPERRLGDFRLRHELGRGGMGVVHAAVQESLGRDVALKVLADGPHATPQAVARFRRESELLARLQHPHLVPVFAAGIDEGVPWFAMELVDGCSLAAVLQHLRSRRPAPPTGDDLATAQAAVLGDATAGARLRADSHIAAVVRCLLPIGEALAFAHGHHVLHRDVKPANILLRRDGTPVLGDFGLARDQHDPALTQTGSFAGTPYYVSPEQASGAGGRVDERTDVFALGVVLYELLLLERPFDGDTSAAVLQQVLHRHPPALSTQDPRLSSDVAAVLDKALQKQPEDRYRSMSELVADLRCLLELRPVSARRSGPLTRCLRLVRRRPMQSAVAGVAAAGVLTAALLSGYLWWQRPRLAAAERAERLPRVEALLEDALMAQHGEDRTGALVALQQAESLLPDLPEVQAELMRHWTRVGDATAAAACAARLGAAAPDVQAQAAMPLPSVEPQTAIGWFVRGSTALDAGNRQADDALRQTAVAALRRALDRAATPRPIYHCQYLRALMAVGAWERVRPLLDDIRHLWPDSPYACYWCGIAGQQLDPAREIPGVERMLARFPQNAALYAVLAQLELPTDPAAAGQHAASAIALRPRWISPRGIQARAWLAAGNTDEALAACDAAVAIAPDSGVAHATRGRVLGQIGRFDEALQACTHACELTPHAGLPLIHRAFVLDRMGRLADAEAAARQAIAKEPGDINTHVALGVALVRRGNHTDAAQVFERVVAMAPAKYSAWFDLGQARLRSRDLEGAETATRAALRLQPGAHKAHIQLAIVLDARKDQAGAEASLLEALRLAPDDAECRVRLAALKFQQGRIAAGLDLCAEARKLWPQLDNGYTLAVRGLVADHRPEEAIALYAELVAQRPGMVTPRLQFCELLLRDLGGRFALEPAEQALLEAEQIEPGRPDTAYWRGELALLRDQIEVARAAFAEAAAAPQLPAPLRQRASERLQSLPR